MNIKIHSTGAESPWQNGLCESNHRHVDQMVEKIKQDEPGIPLKRALAQAVYAKNSLTSHLGFSPIQLVTGQSPRLPSAIENKPPAQEGISISDNVRNRLNAVFAARKALLTECLLAFQIKKAKNNCTSRNLKCFCLD